MVTEHNKQNIIEAIVLRSLFERSDEFCNIIMNGLNLVTLMKKSSSKEFWIHLKRETIS